MEVCDAFLWPLKSFEEGNACQSRVQRVILQTMVNNSHKAESKDHHHHHHHHHHNHSSRSERARGRGGWRQVFRCLTSFPAVIWITMEFPRPVSGLQGGRSCMTSVISSNSLFGLQFPRLSNHLHTALVAAPGTLQWRKEGRWWVWVTKASPRLLHRKAKLLFFSISSTSFLCCWRCSYNPALLTHCLN